MTLRRYWPALAILVIVAVVVGVFVWGGRDEQLRARVGQAFDAPFSFNSDVEVTSRTLRLPYGEVDVDTTAPQSSAPSGLNSEDRTAPDDGSFIGVYVRSSGSERLPLPAVGDTETTAKTEVALVVAGRTYVIPPRFRSPATEPVNRFAWVAVQGSPRDVQVAITYDGVTQSVDARSGKRTTGAAAPLYRLATLKTQRTAKECGAPVTVSDRFRIDPEDEIRCSVQVLGALPYLAGRGWAAKGTVWFSVLVGVFDDARFRRDGQYYRARTGGSGAVVTASTPGTSPEAVRPAGLDGYLPSGAGGRLAALRVPIGTTPTITISATYRDLVRYGRQPAQTVAAGPDATVTWTVKP